MFLNEGLHTICQKGQVFLTQLQGRFNPKYLHDAVCIFQTSHNTKLATFEISCQNQVTPK